MSKQYDRDYFDKWYRGRDRVHARGEVRRKVALAVSVAEYFLRRPLESVLDVGCGEGAWFTHLRQMRRGTTYRGMDSSDYAVKRFGSRRNIRKGSFGDLPRVRGEFDLVVCSDVLHYVPDAEIRAGLPELARLTGGMAYVEILTREDEIIGDLHGLIRRPAAWYRHLLEAQEFVQVGPYCWLSPSLNEEPAEMEIT